MSQQELDALLAKLREQADRGAKGEFSQNEIEAIRRVIRTYELLESWGKLGRFLIWVAMTIAALVVAWEQIKEGLFQ